MLSRTAENLFWMGRYMERADATARLIEMGYRMAMLPGSNELEEWRSVAAASGSAPDIAEATKLNAGSVVQRLLLDPDNASSIRSCRPPVASTSWSTTPRASSVGRSPSAVTPTCGGCSRSTLWPRWRWRGPGAESHGA